MSASCLPYNKDNIHWTLVVVAFIEKKIVYYDSMLGVRGDIVAHVVEYLRLHHQDSGTTDAFPDWEITMRASGYEFTNHYLAYPTQKNGELYYVQCQTSATSLISPNAISSGYDCGLFMLMYCYFISIGLPFVFDQSHMLMIRKRMLLSILDVKPIGDPTIIAYACGVST